MAGHSVAIANESQGANLSWLSPVESSIATLLSKASEWEADNQSDLTLEVPSIALRKGSTGKMVLRLCDALQTRGFGSCKSTNRVDNDTITQIKSAQVFYGLKDDGIADQQLYNALSLSYSHKAKLARLAAADLGDIVKKARQENIRRAILVNIASYQLTAYDNTGAALTSKVIIGRPQRQTPIGLINVTALKFNPNWIPPPGIMKGDVYPSLDRDGSWIKKHGLIMYNQEGDVVDTLGVTSAMAKSMGYKFEQPAGDHAALGRLKFETDSRDHIYLHDTNERSLFNKAARAKSSGCVRVDQWGSLASWIWSQPLDRVQSRVDKRTTTWQGVESTPVFIGYRLADVINGSVVIFPDIYNRNQITAEPTSVKPVAPT